MPPTVPLHRLPKPRNLINRRRLPSKFQQRAGQPLEASIAWNYTTWLNLAFLILAALLISRFLKTGGPAMLRMMNRPADHGSAHHHAA